MEGRSNVGYKQKKLEAVKRQPVNNYGVLLLANEEFGNENGGYESEDTEDEDTLQDTKKRKREAAEKLCGSKKKKQCSEAPGDVANDVHMQKIIPIHRRKKVIPVLKITTQKMLKTAIVMCRLKKEC